ncbi:MAG: tetratricopeptide repeat protein [Oscillospiraceae bacterium]|nr:tetratricopeptide repeat protein [Oscillospiraceae bacterium]
MGDAQLDSEQYDDAIKSFDKARGIFEAIGAEAEKELGYAYTRLGVAYAKIANHAKAQEYFLTALPIYEKTYGTEDRKTAVVYNNIGTTHLWQENYTEAMPFLLKAYKFYLDKLGKEDAKTQETMRNIRRCYHYMGKNPAEFGFWLDCKLNPPQL